MAIGSDLKFKYGMSVTLVWKRGKETLRQVGIVFQSRPLVVSIHGVKIACEPDGKVITEGFGAGAKIVPKEAGDD
jgi:hypothetical protein